MAAYSQDLRDRVLRGLARGERPVDIARRLEVTRVWVYQVKDRYESSGERCSHRVGGYRRSRLAGKEALLHDWIEKQPDLTLAEICERLAEHGVAIKVPALWHQLDKWDLSFKKPCTPASKRARTCGQHGRSGKKINPRLM